MARLAAVADPSEEQRALLEQLARPGDEPGLQGGFVVLAQTPLLLRRLIRLERIFHDPKTSVLLPRTRELAILRVASHTGSRSEYERHIEIASAAGVTGAEADASQRSLDAGPWRDDDRALLELVDEALTTDTVSDASWDSAAAHFRSAQLIELLMLVGCYRMIATFMLATGHDGSPHKSA